MNEKPTPQAQSEETEQRKAQRMRLARAFLEVFGSERKRTASQKLVWEHLGKGIDEDQANTYQFGKMDGISAIACGIQRDGAQSLLRIIKRQISHAETAEQEKPKPNVKR